MTQVVRVKDTSTAPGANGNTTNLFSTVTAGMPANGFASAGLKRFTLTIKCDQNGTLKPYASPDRGTNWKQLDSIAVTAPASTTSLTYDFYVENVADWKLDWVNGGSAQAVWEIYMSMTDERAPLT